MTRHFRSERQVTLREPIPVSASQRISIQISPNQPHNAEVYLIQSEGYVNDTMFSTSGESVNQSFDTDDAIPLCSYRVQQLSTNKLRILRQMKDEDKDVVVRDFIGGFEDLTRQVYDKILVEDILGNVLPTEQESMIA